MFAHFIVQDLRFLVIVLAVIFLGQFVNARLGSPNAGQGNDGHRLIVGGGRDQARLGPNIHWAVALIMRWRHGTTQVHESGRGGAEQE